MGRPFKSVGVLYREIVDISGNKPLASGYQRKGDWSEWADLNRRPHGPKPCALKLSYTPGIVWFANAAKDPNPRESRSGVGRLVPGHPSCAAVARGDRKSATSCCSWSGENGNRTHHSRLARPTRLLGTCLPLVLGFVIISPPPDIEPEIHTGTQTITQEWE